MDSKTVKGQLAYRRQSLKNDAKLIKEMELKCKERKIQQVMTKLCAVEPTTSMWIGSYTCQITVPVKSMKHMVEVLEFITAITGIDFDSSYDCASSGQRIFKNSHYTMDWLNIVAQVPLDPEAAALCRRVQTGVKTVETPVWTLECSDAL
jgi:hypothetical protein